MSFAIFNKMQQIKFTPKHGSTFQGRVLLIKTQRPLERAGGGQRALSGPFVLQTGQATMYLGIRGPTSAPSGLVSAGSVVVGFDRFP